MVFFPLCGVLRGFSAATYNKYVSPQTPARHRERSGEAGGLVRLVELLNFHKNRCEIPPCGGAQRKKSSFMNWKRDSAIHLSWMGTI